MGSEEVAEGQVAEGQAAETTIEAVDAAAPEAEVAAQ